MNKYKSQFPIFKNNPDLIYLDNAATTQKPQSVIDSIVDFYENHNSNVHRGLYPLAEKTTEMYEEARRKVAKFINADPEEIIFVSGTTEGINGIARSLFKSGFISENPRIITTDLEHHSSILPLQDLNPEVVQYLEIDKEMKLKNAELMKDADILSIVWGSNVTGSVFDLKDILKHNSTPYSIVDASQMIGHRKIDVKEIDCDFLVFSGHKMFGPTGIGVIYGKKEILEQLEPFNVGGGMIREVKREGATWAELPEKFEAGTPNIEGAIALGAAIDFINEVGFDEMTKHENELKDYTMNKLKQIDNLRIFHDESKDSLGVISFAHNKIHAHDIAQFLGDRNICVRAGHHCTQIFHRDVLEVPATVRVSFSIYNDKEEVDKFVEILKEAIKCYS
jgi:cysteine desulfurase/selenocysteine lyase